MTILHPKQRKNNPDKNFAKNMQPCQKPAVLLKYSLFGLFAIQQQANIANSGRS
jgi:hypothetical protein